MHSFPEPTTSCESYESIHHQTPETPQLRFSPKHLHRVRPSLKAVTANPKPQKRDNTFSKSRDTREDRGARQMKTAHSPQTFPHGDNYPHENKSTERRRLD
jgi:hypothetical protein